MRIVSTTSIHRLHTLGVSVLRIERANSQRSGTALQTIHAGGAKYSLQNFDNMHWFNNNYNVQDYV